jgi:dTMP kinase
MEQKLFIVIDGIDGSGKTTQVALLKKYLESKNHDVFVTSEPTNGEFGKEIEKILRQKRAAHVSKEKWLELFTKDRQENIKKIRGALDDRKIVICDRYYYSTLAYQLEEDEWQDYASRFLIPNIIFIFDCPVELALNRVKEKYSLTGEKKAYFEKLNILKKVRKKFLLLPNYLNDNIKILNSSGSIQEISKDIKREMLLFIKREK